MIDGTGRARLTDSVVVMRGGRFQAVGKRGEVAIPQGAEVIDAKGKTILPGFIDGHCHYRDWMGELYLAYGVVTCPNISNNPVEWITAQRDGVKNGSIRGPRVWAWPTSSTVRRRAAPARCGASAPALSLTAKKRHAKRCAIWSLKVSTALSCSSA